MADVPLPGALVVKRLWPVIIDAMLLAGFGWFVIALLRSCLA